MIPGQREVDSGALDVARSRPRWLPLLPAVAALVVYLNAWNVPFNFDDYESIVENPSIRSLSDLPAVLQPPPEIGVSGRPLLNLSLALNYAFSKLDVRGYHAVNIALHVAAALALFGVLRRAMLTPPLAGRFGPAAGWLAAVTATLWAVHPLQTMSVTYVIQRAESMVSLAYLLTLYTFLRGATGQRFGWLILSCLCCAAGMACKEVMVTAPVLVLLCDRALFATTFSNALRRRGLYYLGLALTWGLLAWLVLSGPRSASAGFGLLEINAWQYLRTQPEVILHYLSLVVWPHPLVLDYEWPISHSSLKIIPAALVILILLAATARGLIRRTPAALLPAAFFLILAPTSSFVPIIILASEHRMYLPLAAVLTAVVIALHAAVRARLTTPAPAARFATVVLVLAVAAAWGTLTIRRNNIYQSRVELWTDNVRLRPDNPRARLTLGWACFLKGDTTAAIEHYRRALDIAPDYVDAMLNLGELLLRTGQRDEAAQLYQRAITLKPNQPAAHAGLANVWVGLGRQDEAAAEYQHALALNPNDTHALSGYGLLLGARGQAKDAAQLFDRAVRARPDDPSLHFLYGVVLAADNRLDEAIAQFEQVLTHQPGNTAARFRLALCLASANRWAESLVHYRLTLKAEPNNAQVQANYAVALQRAGDVLAAAAAYRHAIQADPNLHEARLELAWLLATHPDDRVRNGGEAVRVAESLADATGRGSFAAMDTLAAAYAEAGRFPDAVLTATKAIELAREAGDTRAMAQIEQRQTLYKRGEPFRADHAHASATGQWQPPS